MTGPRFSARLDVLQSEVLRLSSSLRLELRFDPGNEREQVTHCDHDSVHVKVDVISAQSG